MQRLRKYRACEDGNIAVLFGLFLTVLVGFGGLGLDFHRRLSTQDALQDVADSLATRGAREFLLASATKQQVENLILALAPSYYVSVGGAFEVEPTVDADESTVTLKLTKAAPKGFLLSGLEAFRKDIAVNTTATALGGVNVCVVGLNESDNGVISTVSTAKLSAPNCSLLANSTATRAIDATGWSKLTAKLICSSGGYGGATTNYSPAPVTDCPVYPDPIADRVAPSVGACDETDLFLGDATATTRTSATVASTGETVSALASNATVSELAEIDYETFTLDPGVYCGGLEIGSNADVTLNPGTYIIKDGPLKTHPVSKLTGENVSFYLTGDDAVFEFGADSKISLTAEKSGLLSGLLFFEDRAAPLGRTHKINSDDARTLLGTFYLPRGNLQVSTLFPVADQSAYTAIVSQKLVLTGGPTLVLNTNYASTDVPVPDGVGPVGGQVILRD